MSDPASEDWYINTYLPQQEQDTIWDSTWFSGIPLEQAIHYLKEHGKRSQQEVPKEVTTWDFVCADIAKREEMGLKKYGKYLTPSTSEDMLQHLYEELLDATVYIKTLILQQNKDM